MICNRRLERSINRYREPFIYGGDIESAMYSSPLQLISNLFIWCLCLGLLSSVAVNGFAKGSDTDRAQRAGAFPLSVEALYEGDRWGELKIAAEREMGLYLVEPPRRHISEITDFKDNTLHFHLWSPVNETHQALWSKALGWLVFGRIKYSKGAQQLFVDLPHLKRITISLHEVIRDDKRARSSKRHQRKKRRTRRRPSPDLDTVKTYLTVSLTRADFERMDVARLRECAELLNCDRQIRAMASLIKFNTRYLKQRSR